ncbi:MAG: ribonuclease P protein component [Vicinamibacterales bacterium]
MADSDLVGRSVCCLAIKWQSPSVTRRRVVVNSAQTGNSTVNGAFSKEQRVRRRAQFSDVFARGTRLQGRYFTLLLLPNGHSSPRLGIVASRKLGGAVERNRAKRLVREIFRQHLQNHQGPGVDAVVIPRRELLDAPFPALTNDFRNVWRRGVDRVVTHVRD